MHRFVGGGLSLAGSDGHTVGIGIHRSRVADGEGTTGEGSIEVELCVSGLLPVLDALLNVTPCVALIGSSRGTLDPDVVTLRPVEGDVTTFVATCRAQRPTATDCGPTKECGHPRRGGTEGPELIGAFFLLCGLRCLRCLLN